MDEPADAEERRKAPPVVCYPPTEAIRADLAAMRTRRAEMRPGAEVVVPPRDARCFRVARGGAFRISCPDGAQVGDLNLWSARRLDERFYSGKTRALHGSHLTAGARLWSAFPHLRPMATIIADTLAWYRFDTDGAGVHDVIGTRCDPYTARLMGGVDYHRCCHSNLTRALADATGMSREEAEPHVHDVLNVFMCTGFFRETGQYFMKASPARVGDHIEFFAEIDLLCALSACPGGDCGAEHSSDTSVCHPLLVEVFEPADATWPEPAPSPYDRSHGA